MANDNISTENNMIANITVSPDYFKRCSINEYSQPISYIWIREAIQNSVDAGASQVHIKVTEDQIIVADNGSGMNVDIINNKLLVMGGTFKAEGSTGGFGKAKEVLFFCWDEWKIVTSMDGKNQYMIDESMIGNKPVQHIVEDECWKGTVIAITYDSEEIAQWKWEDTIEEYIESCTCKCEFFLNDRNIQTAHMRGSTRELTFGKLKVNKQVHSNYLYVRINGITMFKKYLSGDIPARIFLDLEGDSTKYLSSSRETLVHEYQRELDGIVSSIITNPKTAMDEADERYFVEYIGEDISWEARKWVRKIVAEKVDKTPMGDIEELFENLEEFKAKVAENANDVVEQVTEIVEACTENGLTDHEEVKKEVYKCENEDVIFAYNEIKKEIKVSPSGYEFIVDTSMSNRGNAKLPVNVEGRRCQKILHHWTQIVKKLVQDRNIRADIGVGFIFDDKTVAQHTTRGGKHYFLINPNTDKIPSVNNSKALAYQIFPIACHEVAHYYGSWHDENFSSTMTDMAATMGTDYKAWMKLFNGLGKDFAQRMA